MPRAGWPRQLSGYATTTEHQWKGHATTRSGYLWDKDHPLRFIELAAFWIDRTEVTNDSYCAFLVQARYRPRDLTNFLRHWHKPAGSEQAPWTWSPRAGKERHPVNWVDLDDARADVGLTVKSRSREEDWQKAAGFAVWPWGDGFDPSLCNSVSDDTTPHNQFPGSASHVGRLDMAAQRLGVDRPAIATTAKHTLRHYSGRQLPQS